MARLTLKIKTRFPSVRPKAKRLARFRHRPLQSEVRVVRAQRGVRVGDVVLDPMAGARTGKRIGQRVELVYSRVGADSTLREARVAPGA